MNLNKVILIGRLTRNPELTYSGENTAICNFSIATNRVFGDKKEVEYHNVVAFGKAAENISEYMGKGNLIMVEGHLKTSSWEKDGERRYRTQIVVERVQFGPKQVEEEQGDQNDEVPF